MNNVYYLVEISKNCAKGQCNRCRYKKCGCAHHHSQPVMKKLPKRIRDLLHREK